MFTSTKTDLLNLCQETAADSEARIMFCCHRCTNSSWTSPIPVDRLVSLFVKLGRVVRGEPDTEIPIALLFNYFDLFESVSRSLNQYNINNNYYSAKRQGFSQVLESNLELTRRVQRGLSLVVHVIQPSCQCP